MIENPDKKYVQLCTDHLNGKLSLADLMKECAYWFADCFEELRVKPYPTCPKEYAEYEVMTLSEKNKVPKEFWYQAHIKTYLDQKDSIKNENFSRLAQLREHKENIPVEDHATHEKYQHKIFDFEERLQSINSQRAMIPAHRGYYEND